MQPSAERQPEEGKLKVILGYAAGVGKTFKMLDEGQHLAAAGHDVAVGYFEPHARKDTIAKTEGLEIVPRRIVEYRDRQFDEMDTEAILAALPKSVSSMSSLTPTSPVRRGPSDGRMCWSCSPRASTSSRP